MPLAYVTSTDGISVIDTGDNKIVDTIPSCSTAAVTPDGKHVYAFGPNTSDFQFNIFVIDATNDKVVAKIPLERHRRFRRGEPERKIQSNSDYPGWEICLRYDRALF